MDSDIKLSSEAGVRQCKILCFDLRCYVNQHLHLITPDLVSHSAATILAVFSVLTLCVLNPPEARCNDAVFWHQLLLVMTQVIVWKHWNDHNKQGSMSGMVTWSSTAIHLHSMASWKEASRAQGRGWKDWGLYSTTVASTCRKVKVRWGQRGETLLLDDVSFACSLRSPRFFSFYLEQYIKHLYSSCISV